MIAKIAIWTATLIGTLPVLALAILHLVVATSAKREGEKKMQELIAQQNSEDSERTRFMHLGTSSWSISISGRELPLHFRPLISVLAIMGVVALLVFVAFTLHVPQRG